MKKDFIEEFIPSKDTKAYLHSIHHEFTDMEKATIVANHIMNQISLEVIILIANLLSGRKEVK